MPVCTVRSFLKKQDLITRHNHNYNKILKSDWLSTILISALLKTVRVTPKIIGQTCHCVHLKWLFFSLLAKTSQNLLFLIQKNPKISQIL